MARSGRFCAKAAMGRRSSAFTEALLAARQIPLISRIPSRFMMTGKNRFGCIALFWLSAANPLIQRLQMNRLRHIWCKSYNGQPLFISSFIVSPAIPFSVKIHSCHTGFTMNHTKKAPAVSLIKRGMVRDKIERIYPVFFHIRAHMMKQRTCNTMPAAVFFRINGADVGRQILSIVKIIFNDSQPSDDSVARHGQIPLRHNTIPGKAVLHTLQIRIQRNPPFFVKPLRRFFFICRFVF